MVLRNILLGASLIAVGVISLKFNFQLVGLTGKLNWIESKLGYGTTYLFYKLLSVALVLIGIIFVAGLSDNIGNLLLTPIRDAFSLE